jgi:hypothetical protein
MTPWPVRLPLAVRYLEYIPFHPITTRLSGAFPHFKMYAR